MRFYYTLFLLIVLLSENVLSQNIGFNTPVVVTNTYQYSKRIKVIDIDTDGDMDIIAANSNQNAVDDNISWFRNDGTSFTKISIDTDFQGARSVDVADLNDDGSLDIVGVSRLADPISWWTNDVPWSKNVLDPIYEENHAIIVVDLNNDYYPDIVSARALGNEDDENAIFWYENDPVDPGNFTMHLVNSIYQDIISIEVVDLDNDDDLDIVVANVGNNDIIVDDEVIWLENDGSQAFTEREIEYDIDAPMYIDTEDVDKDGYVDVLVALWGHFYSNTHYLYWYRNDGKSGSDITKSWEKRMIVDDFYNPRSAIFIDLDGDDDLDVVGAACDYYDLGGGGYVTWWECDGSPLDGGWARTDLITDFDYAYHAVAEDMDDDGDFDIIASAQDLGAIYWWENTINGIAQNIATSTDYDLWNNKVRVNFSAGPSGSEFVKLFFNSGDVSNRNVFNAVGIHHIALKGFYTFKTDMSSYTSSLRFYYADIESWIDIDNPDDLIICHWDGTEWVKTPNQNLPNTTDSYIDITSFSAMSVDKVLFTLASATQDNPLPVDLLSFTAKNLLTGVELSWETRSELENDGFELWRKSSPDSVFRLIATYRNESELIGLGSSSFGKKYSYVDSDVQTDYDYEYKLFDVTYKGLKSEKNRLSIKFIPTDIEGIFFAKNLYLFQNYPNPFNNSTTISFNIPDLEVTNPAFVNLTIYDMIGSKIKSLFKGNLADGYSSFIWDGTNEQNQFSGTGTYICRLQVNNKIVTRKILLMK